MIIFSIFLQWSNVLAFGEIGMERKNYRASVKVQNYTKKFKHLNSTLNRRIRLWRVNILKIEFNFIIIFIRNPFGYGNSNTFDSEGRDRLRGSERTFCWNYNTDHGNFLSLHLEILLILCIIIFLYSSTFSSSSNVIFSYIYNTPCTKDTDTPLVGIPSSFAKSDVNSNLLGKFILVCIG